MVQKKFSFKKVERLSGKIQFNNLFSSGHSLYLYPFLLIWKITEADQACPVKAAFIAPKKKIKKAVKRNYIKRRIKESYRHHKIELCDFLNEKKINIHLAIVYKEANPVPFKTLDEKINQCLKRLEKEITKQLCSYHEKKSNKD